MAKGVVNWINISVKLFAVVFIVVGFALKASGLTPDVSVNELVIAAGGMVAIFFPVDVSKAAKAIRGDSK